MERYYGERRKGKSPTTLDVCETHLAISRPMICRNEKIIREQTTLNLPVEEKNCPKINSNERAHMIIRKKNVSFT